MKKPRELFLSHACVRERQDRSAKLQKKNLNPDNSNQYLNLFRSTILPWLGQGLNSRRIFQRTRVVPKAWFEYFTELKVFKSSVRESRRIAKKAGVLVVIHLLWRCLPQLLFFVTHLSNHP